MIKNTYKKQSGFSLIETLIAVSILMIAIAGPFALVQAGLFSSIHQRDQVTATYLAQEAIEYIKNVRDGNSYSQYSGGNVSDWLTGPDGSSMKDTCADNGCYVDLQGNLDGGFIKKVDDGGDKKITQTNSSDGVFRYYGYESSNGNTIKDTGYTRVVKITPVVGTLDEVTVTVIVGWKEGAIKRSHTVSENIYNYAQYD